MCVYVCAEIHVHKHTYVTIYVRPANDKNAVLEMAVCSFWSEVPCAQAVLGALLSGHSYLGPPKK